VPHPLRLSKGAQEDVCGFLLTSSKSITFAEFRFQTSVSYSFQMRIDSIILLAHPPKNREDCGTHFQISLTPKKNIGKKGAPPAGATKNNAFFLSALTLHG
jgi:hypothetical protein